MKFRHRDGWLVAALLVVSAPAVGQERFTLGDDDEWSSEATLQPGTSAAELAEIRRLLGEKQYDRAESLATSWIERHPRDPLLPDAYLARADAKIGNDDEYEALYDLEYVARVHPASDVFVQALERELDIAARYTRGLKRKQWGVRMFSATEEAEELLIRIQERLPGSSLAERAGLELAEYYFRDQQMDMAADAYDLFILNYPDSEHVPVARRRLIYSYLAAFKGPRFDASGLYEARALLEQLKRQEPVTAQRIGADALQVRIDESDALKQLTTAQWYVQTGDAISAELTIRRLIRTYPRSVAARDAVDLAVTLLSNLPPIVLEECPDYASIQAGLRAAMTDETASPAAIGAKASEDGE